MSIGYRLALTVDTTSRGIGFGICAVLIEITLGVCIAISQRILCAFFNVENAVCSAVIQTIRNPAYVQADGNLRSARPTILAGSHDANPSAPRTYHCGLGVSCLYPTMEASVLGRVSVELIAIVMVADDGC